MGLIFDIKKHGKKIEKISFDFYLFSGEEQIIYCYFKEGINANSTFGGGISLELSWLFRFRADFAAATTRFIFDLSVLGQAAAPDFFNNFRRTLVMFRQLSKKRVDMIISRGAVRNSLNRVFEEHCRKTGDKFFAVPPFDGGQEELATLEKVAHIPEDEEEAEWDPDVDGMPLDRTRNWSTTS